MTDNKRAFFVTIQRREPGKFGIGIAEHIDIETLWIASIYLQNKSNSQVLETICSRINDELNTGEDTRVVFSDYKYYRLLDKARVRNPHLDINIRGKQIHETYFLAKDALKRQSSITERLKEMEHNGKERTA